MANSIFMGVVRYLVLHVFAGVWCEGRFESTRDYCRNVIRRRDRAILEHALQSLVGGLHGGRFTLQLSG